MKTHLNSRIVKFDWKRSQEIKKEQHLQHDNVNYPREKKSNEDDDDKMGKSSYIQDDQAVYFSHKPWKAWKKGVVQKADHPHIEIKSADDAVYNRYRIHLRPTRVPVHSRDLFPLRNVTNTNNIGDNYDTLNTPTANTQRLPQFRDKTRYSNRLTFHRCHDVDLAGYAQKLKQTAGSFRYTQPINHAYQHQPHMAFEDVE
ncbi:hypothetical protein DPMN_008182 [Dreissena polymorpha]|uniref:Uncharacterized protein n=1 Tax=Dreissena polymorpha TaxID=45954 RepID=A0A9D4RZE1_DREPO|nr:hypothetical protein DPMN_008182 [Dreissena polymorpha]